MTQQSTPQPLTGIAVTYNGRGGYEVIQTREREVRPPAAGEVRIQVKAAAVNPTDLLLRAAGAGAEGASIVPGMDAAGIVESVGAGVERLRPGDNVMAAVMPRRPEGGAQAQYIVVPAASVVPVPEGASFEEAATLPMNGLTALLALDHANVSRGQVLGVSGGAGLLAGYAIAAAKQRGLQVVADAKPEDIAWVKRYGADIVVPRGEDFAAAVRHALPEGIDALLDTAVLGERTFAAIRDGGVYLPLRGWAGKPAERGIQIKPVFVHEALERTGWLEQLREWVAARAITLRVTHTYAPQDAAAAQRSLQGGGLRGRPVIVF